MLVISINDRVGRAGRRVKGYERVLGAEVFRAALAVPLGEAEAEEARSLIRWLRRRHPTPADRLAYARAYRRWAAAGPGP